MADSATKHNRVFGIVMIVVQIGLGFVYGFCVDYSQRTGLTHYLVVVTAVMLALLGFGMLFAYVQEPTPLSIVHLIIIFAISLQLYFPMFGFWEFIRLTASRYMQNPESDKVNILPISLINDFNDRQSSDQLQQVSIFSWVQCLISLLVSYSAVIGRVGYIQVLLLTIFGTFGYTFNQLLFWNFFITDCGGAMRIFLFGGVMGIIIGALLSFGRRQTVLDHPYFSSTKQFQTFAFVGSIIIAILLPVLNWVDLFHSDSTGKDGYILHTVSLNMWLSLCGSVIGSYSFSLLKYKKLSIHDITYSLFTGVIGYMAISDLYFNPGVAIAIGTLVGFISALCLNIKWFMNFNGVIDSTGVIHAFIIPGLLSSILSAIFQANTPQTLGGYDQANASIQRTNFQNGGYQLAGAALSIAIAIVFGLLIGFLARLANTRTFDTQFKNDNHLAFDKSIINPHDKNNDKSQ